MNAVLGNNRWLFHSSVQSTATDYIAKKVSILGAFPKLKKASNSFTSVRSSAKNNSAPKGQIFVQVHI
jgi:hypothetical protein